jgi:hypothetical protein
VTDDPTAFETDFWKDEVRRATWSDIEVGVERTTRPVTLTLEIIQAYARAVTMSGRVTHVRQEGDWVLYAADVAATRQDGVVAQTGDACGRIPASGAAPLEAFIR